MQVAVTYQPSSPVTTLKAHHHTGEPRGHAEPAVACQPRHGRARL